MDLKLLHEHFSTFQHLRCFSVHQSKDEAGTNEEIMVFDFAISDRESTVGEHAD